MKGYLRYTGESPIHSLKQDWTPGMEISIDKLHSILGKASPSSQPDEAFVLWFHEKYMEKLSGSFELVLQEEDIVTEEENLEVAKLLSTTERSGSVNIEAAEVTTSSSIQEAQAKLKSMRHPDAVGEISLTKHEEVASEARLTRADEIRKQKEALGAVMTGDDLREQQKLSSMVLQQDGSAKAVAPINKDKDSEDITKMANLSRRASILTPELINSDGTKSQVVTGEDTPGTKTQVGFQKKTVEGLEDSNRKNKNFKGYQSFSPGAQITPEAIMSAKTEIDAKMLIEECKDPTTLRVAKIYAKNNGNHRIRELLERRLRSLPHRG